MEGKKGIYVLIGVLAVLNLFATSLQASQMRSAYSAKMLSNDIVMATDLPMNIH